VRIVVGDVRRPETHDELVSDAVKSFGGLDVAFNNAATVGPLKPLADVAVSEWQKTLAANLTSAFLASRCQIPAMLERGSLRDHLPIKSCGYERRASKHGGLCGGQGETNGSRKGNYRR
jgi:NAD(P)-dependent dehydrogenase (short-subunit alcohol dehydrogenase family)